MPKIALARVDDRLLHGQVVIKWLRAVPCDEILICDDQVRQDVFLQTVLKLATPRGMPLSIKSVAETIAYLQGTSSADPAGTRHPAVMLIMKSPDTALKLLKAGVHFDALNIGGMAALPGSTRLYKSISATPQQIVDLQEIARLGVRVVLQTVPEPEEAALDFKALMPVR